METDILEFSFHKEGQSCLPGSSYPKCQILDFNHKVGIFLGQLSVWKQFLRGWFFNLEFYKDRKMG